MEKLGCNFLKQQPLILVKSPILNRCDRLQRAPLWTRGVLSRFHCMHVDCHTPAESRLSKVAFLTPSILSISNNEGLRVRLFEPERPFTMRSLGEWLSELSMTLVSCYSPQTCSLHVPFRGLCFLSMTLHHGFEGNCQRKVQGPAFSDVTRQTRASGKAREFLLSISSF